MTLEWVISELGKDGQATKKEVKEALKKASCKELMELRRSVNETINRMCEESERR